MTETMETLGELRAILAKPGFAAVFGGPVEVPVNLAIRIEEALTDLADEVAQLHEDRAAWEGGYDFKQQQLDDLGAQYDGQGETLRVLAEENEQLHAYINYLEGRSFPDGEFTPDLADYTWYPEEPEAGS